MATVIATVLNTDGDVWARDEDGNLRQIEAGDKLYAGEVLVTAANASAQLDFGDGSIPIDIAGGQQIAMLPGLMPNAGAQSQATQLASEDSDDASVLDQDVQDVLAALNAGEGDLLDQIEAPAAGPGAGGGGADAGGGHDFVVLNRIALDLPPQGYDFPPTVPLDLPEIPQFGDEGVGAIADGATPPPATPPGDTPPPSAPPSIEMAEATLSEEALPNGIVDNASTDGGSFSYSGTVDVEGSGSLEVTLTAPADGDIKSGGESVEWSLSEDGQTLTGSTDSGGDVITVTIDDSGRYEVTLNRPLDHEEPPEGTLSEENTLEFNVGMNVGDGTNSDSADLTIKVDDDSPVAENVIDHVEQDTNILLILDTSQSMGGLGPTTLLEEMQEAVKELLQQYGQMGDVRVRIVDFGGTGNAGVEPDIDSNDNGWIQIGNDDSGAIQYINALSAQGQTYYEEALAAAQSAFNDSTGRLSDAKNVAYFISGGEPTDDGYGSIDWKDFLENNNIDAHALGVGEDMDPSVLDPIADDVIMVGKDDHLGETLTSTISGEITGSLFGDHGGFGADGGYVDSISVGGVVHGYDDADTNQNGEHVLTVQTDDGTITLNMDNGEYTYTVQGGNVGMNSIDYTLSDSDGDMANGTVEFHVGDATVFDGTTENDLIDGTNGADAFVGGAGNDTLIGHYGDDTFVWNLGDPGSVDNPAHDVVVDFNASEGDKLDLSDLLQGESEGNIGNYLHFTSDGQGGTTIHVSTQGNFDNQSVADATDQMIQLDGVPHDGGANDAAIAQSMIEDGHLLIGD